MLILYLNDGLGNQMFQFALFRKLQKLGKEVCIYDLDLRRKDALHNGLELERVFGLKYNTISFKEFRKYDTKNLYNHIMRKLFYEKKYLMYEERGLSYKPEIFSLDNICLKGYWQSEKYFQGIEELIRKDFSFPPFQDEKNLQILETIRESTSVAVHVRRGDYLSPQYKNSFGSVCDEAYYRKAIAYMKNRLGDVKLFFFSNDVEWCRDKFSSENAVFVEGNAGNDSYRDMQLMSECQHQIIANSSFSWWAAWLNKNKEKIVAAPSVWIKGENVQDILCEGWERIGE